VKANRTMPWLADHLDEGSTTDRSHVHYERPVDVSCPSLRPADSSPPLQHNNTNYTRCVSDKNISLFSRPC